MSVDQTFHTPSFGDEEFEIPPLTYAHTAAATRCSVQGVFANQVPVEYLKRKLSCDQISVYLPRPEESYPDCQNYNNQHQTHLQPQQNGYLLHPSSPQGHLMNNGSYHQQQHSPPGMQHGMYQGDVMSHSMGMHMQYENHTQNADASWQQQNAAMQHQMQMNLMQQPQQNHLMGPPQQQLFTTINQSQMSNQLGLQLGMGQPAQGGSPPGSNHNSPVMESSEDSDDSTPLAQLKKQLNPEPVETTVTKIVKKPKAQKKKKKRDPNEPQKPVSAYALFFRDTQAAIKGQNPNASFGEVSKIVASMWDSLDADRKQSYRAKTEAAKKEYLKALAAYRANLVSKAAVDQSDSMYGSNSAVSSSPPANSPNASPPGRMISIQKPILTSVVDSMQPVSTSMGVHPQGPQVWHMQSPPQMSNGSPPHMLQGNNTAMMGMHQQHMSPQQSHMSPPQQQMMSRQQMTHENSASYNHNMSPQQVNSGGNLANMGNGGDMMPSIPTCLRSGCSNPAIDSPDWDREYCSSECVVSHCKDVFATWVAQRQVPSNPYSTVK